MNQHHSKRLGWSLLLTLSILLAACGGNADQPAQQASRATDDDAPATQSKQTAGPKPGFATGKLTMADGSPITAPNSKLSVSLQGISSQSGERLQYNPKVKPDGTYEQKLVDGTYGYYGAHVEVQFNGKNYRYDLEPVGDDRADREASEGIVQNYVWKLTGARPGRDAEEGNHTHWYGAGVNAQFAFYREDIKKAVAKPPQGTQFVFTLTPQGKLIDGSDGKELTFTRELDPLLSGLSNGLLHDIPMGVYTIKGEQVSPDGTRKPLLIQQAYAKYGDSTKVEFAPGSGTGVWPTPVGFTIAE